MPEAHRGGATQADKSNPSLVEVRYTANFEANLESIETFWDENGFPQGYDRLLDELLETVVPNLESHPRMGRPFLSRQPASVEAHTLLERLKTKMAADDRSADMREYVMESYLVLYAVLDAAAGEPSTTIYLVSVKHHKQLSFDFERLWHSSKSS